jgi:hypothetical protein
VDIKNKLLEIDFVRKYWTHHASGQMHQRYRKFDAIFGSIAHEKGLIYSEANSYKELQKRISGFNITPKKSGMVHTGIVVLTDNWGIAYVQELEELGPVSVFDWKKEGFSGPEKTERITALNKRLLEYFRYVHNKHPLDWIFMPITGSIVLKETIQRIRDEFRIPVINNWLDCKQNFAGGKMACGQDRGQIDIAPEFDLVCTSSRSTCEWYMAIGANPLFLPEGFSPRLTPRVDCHKIYDVGFLGAKYGPRCDYTSFLSNAGINIETRGYGWEKGGISLNKMGSFFGQCKVNLGMGGIGYSTDLLTLKGRDFEVPGAGGVYLTSFNPDLADFFEIGKEIVCYQSLDEMLFLSRCLLNNDDWRRDIAERAYKRSMREHRWLHRFEKILSLLGILEQRQ